MQIQGDSDPPSRLKSINFAGSKSMNCVSVIQEKTDKVSLSYNISSAYFTIFRKKTFSDLFNPSKEDAYGVPLTLHQ